MSATPKISVLIPTYNYARYLPEAINSVLTQEFRDYELLIVDDGSADNSVQVAQAFCSRDARIKFSVNQTNLGMVRNWNYCLEQARGEYIKFLFGDDRLCGTQALGKLAALLDRHPSATLASSARVILDEHSKVVNIWRPLPAGCHKGKQIITACLMKNGQNVIGEPSAVMFRKTGAGRGFAPSLKQIVDIEMWFHLLEKGDLAYTREPLCAFRVHADQETARNTVSGVAWQEHAAFIASYAAREEFPREVVFPILYHLRRWQAKIPAAGAPEMLEWQRRLAARWGAGWRWPYWFFCARHKITKPFANFARSLEKRRFRRQFTFDSDKSPPV